MSQAVPMSNRGWLLIAIGALGLALVTLIVILTPWHVLPVAIHPLPASNDFQAADLSRIRAFHSSLMPWGIGSWVLGLVLVGIAGFTSIGARLLDLLPGPYFLKALLGVFVVELAINIAQIPLDIKRENVLRSYGLSTYNWRGWLVDRIQHFVIGAGLTGLGLAFLVLLAHWFGERWWIIGGAGAALMVVVLSFGYPLVFEPIFNKFTPMSASPLRDELMTMAARDGVPVKQILVADASRRTTALNAYVSGFGATRRIVLYDVLLKDASPSEVKLVVAHELGHAKTNDVGRFTVVGALSTALGLLLIAFLLTWNPLLRRAGLQPGSNALADPRSVPLLLALIALLTLLQQPVSALLSRNIEARADVHALNLTHDANDFVAMQRTLAISNLSDPNPKKLIFWFLDTHPTPPQRIAIARAWAQLNQQEQPPAITSR